MPDLRLPSQPQSITAHRPVPNYILGERGSTTVWTTWLAVAAPRQRVEPATSWFQVERPTPCVTAPIPSLIMYTDTKVQKKNSLHLQHSNMNTIFIKSILNATVRDTPFTRYSRLSNRLSFVKRVWQPVECLYTRYNRLSNRFDNRSDNRFDNRFYRVNGAWQ